MLTLAEFKVDTSSGILKYTINDAGERWITKHLEPYKGRGSFSSPTLGTFSRITYFEKLYPFLAIIRV